MRLAKFLTRHRWAVLAFLVVATAWGAAEAPRLRFDFTPQAVFEGNDDLVRYDEDFKATFGYEDAVLLVILRSDGPGDVLAPPALTWQAETAADLARLAQVQRVESLASLRVPRRVLGLPAGSTPLLAPGPLTAPDEARVRRAVARMPLVRGELVSADATMAKIVVFIDPSDRSAERMRRALADVRQSLAQRPPPAGYSVGLGGLPAMRVDVVRSLRADLFSLLPLAGLLFLVVLAVEFRSVGGTLLPLAAVGVGLAWMAGILVLAGQSLNIVSNVLPVMLFVIGMANCVHMVHRYAEECERTPSDPVGAAHRTTAYMLVACLLTSLTTAVGFGSLMAARSQVLRALGLHAAIGIGLQYVSTILVLGTFLPSFRAPRYAEQRRSHLHPVGRFTGWAAHAVARSPGGVLAVGAVVIVVSVWFARGARMNSRMMETYDPAHPMMRTLGAVDEKLGGVLPLEVSLAATGENGLLDASVYRRAAAAQAFAASQPEVVSARSYVDLIQEVYAATSGRDAARGELPGDDAAGGERIRLLADLARGQNDTVHLESFLTADGRRGRILLRVRDVGTQRALGLIESLQQRLADLFPPGGGIEARLTGDVYVHARAMDRFVRDLFWSLLTAVAVIFTLIGLLFWSLRLGLVAVLPNLTPLLVTLAYMTLRGFDLNAANVIVFAISIGLAVDNTIHFMARFRAERKLDGDVIEAVRRSFRGAGRAVVAATVLVVTGLAVLLASSFIPSRRFAELTAVTLAVALLGNLFLLPACLRLLLGRGGRARHAGQGPPLNV